VPFELGTVFWNSLRLSFPSSLFAMTSLGIRHFSKHLKGKERIEVQEAVALTNVCLCQFANKFGLPKCKFLDPFKRKKSGVEAASVVCSCGSGHSPWT